MKLIPLTHLRFKIFSKLSLVLIGAFTYQLCFSQNPLPFTDFSFFQSQGSTWKLAGDVHADFTQKAVLTTSPGTGIIVNLTDFSNTGQNLAFTLQHGDMDMELDFMLASGSNSGIFLQGRYEIQLADSWGVSNPTSVDNGGVSERWNESRPEGQKSFEGHAPRQNAGRAPGLWQRIKISFQAPRFANGQKIENAKILSLELNGVTIQENVELSGPTRDAVSRDEVPLGPLILQGDRGPVAFKNLKFTSYNKPRPELLNLKYSVYKGKFEKEPDYKKLPPEAQGTTAILSSTVNTIPNEFLIRYVGTLRVKEAGEYNFSLRAAGGKGSMKIGEQLVIPIPDGQGRGRLSGRATLQAGDLPFELLYTKFTDFAQSSLGLAVTGPGIREYFLSDAGIPSGSGGGGDPVDPIPIVATVNTILRSFSDLPDNIKITHAVNVGSPQQVHYTFDMNTGMLVQVWRGNFLDATPMWHSRGDGTSRPSGMVQRLGKPMMAMQSLPSPDAAWPTDTAGTGYKSKGYTLDKSDRPTFRYSIYNTMVSDMMRVLDNNQGIRREVSLQNPVNNLYLRLAAASNIETVSNGLYLLGDKSYYLRIDDAGGAKPFIRDASGQKELIIPVQNKVTYSILF